MKDKRRTLPLHSQIEHVQVAQQSIELISQATLDNMKLNDSTWDHLENLIEEHVDNFDPDIHLLINQCVACDNASECTYKAVMAIIHSSCFLAFFNHHHPQLMYFDLPWHIWLPPVLAHTFWLPPH